MEFEQLMQATPGYTFGGTEVPTRGLLEQALGNMTLTGIAADAILPNLVGLTMTDNSQTSLASEGWMWVDSRSNIWIKTRNGHVRVRCSEGGWESVRWPYGVAATASPTSLPGSVADFVEFIANNTQESNTCLRIRAGGFSNGSTWHIGVNQETVPSTATTAPGYFRTIYRGWTRFYAPDFMAAATTVDRGRLYRLTAFSNEWVHQEINDNVDRVIHADVVRADPDGDTGNYAYGYFFPGLLSN